QVADEDSTLCRQVSVSGDPPQRRRREEAVREGERYGPGVHQRTVRRVRHRGDAQGHPEQADAEQGARTGARALLSVGLFGMALSIAAVPYAPNSALVYAWTVPLAFANSLFAPASLGRVS